MGLSICISLWGGGGQFISKLVSLLFCLSGHTVILVSQWFLHLFPTSLCGVLVFRFAPAAPSASRRASSSRHAACSHTTWATSHLITAHLITQTSHRTASHTNYQTASHIQLLTQQSDHTVTAATSSHSTHHSTTHGFRVAGAGHRAFWRSWCARGRLWAAAGFRVAGSWLLCGRKAQYTEPPGGVLGWLSHHLWHTISHTTLSHTIFHTTLSHTLSFTHNFVTHHLSHTQLCHTLSFTHYLSGISHTTLSHTIFDTPLCHTPSFTPLCHTLSFTRNFVTHHLSHTTFHTHNFVTPSLSHTTFTHHLSHTTLSHTIFDTPLCHTPSLTHHLWVFYTPSFTHHLWHTIFCTPSFTHNFVPHHLSPHHLCHTPSFTTPSFTHTTLSHTIFPPPPPLSFLPSPSPLPHFLLIIGRSWLVGLSGPFICCFCLGLLGCQTLQILNQPVTISSFRYYPFPTHTMSAVWCGAARWRHENEII